MSIIMNEYLTFKWPQNLAKNIKILLNFTMKLKLSYFPHKNLNFAEEPDVQVVIQQYSGQPDRITVKHE